MSPRRGVFRVLRLVGLLAALAIPAARAAAQPAPHARWRTIDTPHFRVHYAPPLDSLARRAAASAERAWSLLAAELAPPRGGRIDLVLSDDVDYSNGYATPFPSNRIVVFATPPVDGGTLRHYHDWLDLVVTHELAHIFHLDRARGWWGVAQRVLGRNPGLFPNAYAPSWLIEGLAVHYESRLTGSGRLAGTAHQVYARAASLGGRAPRIDQLSAANPAFPGGSVAYVYGSLLVDRLAARRGPAGVRAFVDHAAGETIPFRLDHLARATFGQSFTASWADWRDSISGATRATRAAHPASAGVGDDALRRLTRDGWYVRSPRWFAPDSVLWIAAPGRDVPGLYASAARGRPRRLARRTSLDVNAPDGKGGVVWAQLELAGPYATRSDLWHADAAGRARRLTRGARLINPDVRAADGAIVAAQIAGGTTRLVRLAADGSALRALSTTHVDTQWAEPRWSPRGDRIVAARRVRGGRSEIVVADSAGGDARVVAASDWVDASPTWAADGGSIVFVSDRDGVPRLHVARVDGTTAVAASGSRPDAPALFWPDVRPDSGRGARTAVVTLEADGFHVALTDGLVSVRADSVPRADDAALVPETARRERPRRAVAALDSALVHVQGASRAYSPWPMLVPRWWLPLASETSEGDVALGAASSSSDIVGRHAWGASVLVPTRRVGEADASLAWRWQGLGQPVLDLSLSQDHDAGAVEDTTSTRIGRFVVRERTVALAATVVRPRVYSSSALSVGAELESRVIATEPDALLARLRIPRAARFPALFATASWGALERAPLAVSLENGLALRVTARERWQGDAGLANGRSAVAVGRAYRALDLPGYARHVVAVRLSAGAANDASIDDFRVGGTSGGAVELLPGVVVGDSPRSFGVRGFRPGTLRGARAAGGSLEYRAPLLLGGRGLGLLPVFLGRTGVAAFGDAGAASCPRRSRVCPSGASDTRWIGSVGGEVFADAAVPYDVVYRARAGVAVPVRGASLGRRGSAPSVYVSFGSAF